VADSTPISLEHPRTILRQERRQDAKADVADVAIGMKYMSWLFNMALTGSSENVLKVAKAVGELQDGDRER
jgi:hypothetical protein